MKHIFLAERFGEQEYAVNGVRYIVGSSFQSSKVPTSTTIHDRFKRIVSGDTVPLSLESVDGICVYTDRQGYVPIGQRLFAGGLLY